MIAGVASCLGEFSRHCEAAELDAMLRQGPLVAAAGSSLQRLGAALTLASCTRLATARSAGRAQCGCCDVGLIWTLLNPKP